MAVAVAASCATTPGDADRGSHLGPAGPATEGTVRSGAAIDPTADAGGAWRMGPLHWEPCGSSHECATVTVPLDHGDPGSAATRLALIREPADDPDRRLGSLFVNPGGPGASGVDLLRSGFRLHPDIHARYDVVSFDPRGVGRSDPLGCDPDLTTGPLPDPSPDTPAELARLDDWAASLGRRCAATDGHRLAHLGTDTVARDLDLLRQAVGDERLTYYGLSYGTLLGLRYLQQFPDRAGRLVLDGVVDPALTLPELLEQQAAAFERVFDDVAEACARSTDCPPEGLARAYDQVVASVEVAPSAGVGPAEVASAAVAATYRPESWPALWRALDAAAQGDASDIEALSDGYHRGFSFAAYAAVSCVDSPTPTGAAAWDALVAGARIRAPRFGAPSVNELRTCAHWPVRSTRTPVAVTTGGTEPILVVGTTGDAATPVTNAMAVARALPDARLLIREGAGHTAVGDPCVDDVMATYLVDGRLPEPGTRC